MGVGSWAVGERNVAGGWFFPPGWKQRLYGRQGCLPLHAVNGGIFNHEFTRINTKI